MRPIFPPPHFAEIPSECALFPRPRVGLSTDLYSPPFEDLLEVLSDGPAPEYLELFRGRTSDLSEARRRIPAEIPLAYHGDCLWYTQAEFPSDPAYREEIQRARGHMEALESPWMIHECAQKTMEGYAFGLYAPPLLTLEGALAARRGALHLLENLGGRLLLVETPPFPPHPPGPLDLGEFFHLLTRETPLGVGLDLGHCLTYLSVAGCSATPSSLVEWLRNSFPLDRVVEIHVGGLAARTLPAPKPPLQAPFQALIDDHTEAVPDLLFECLESVLRDLALPSLAGVALEVDNKALCTIAREFSRFHEIVVRTARPGGRPLPPSPPAPPIPLTPEAESRLRGGYRALGRSMAGSPDSPYARCLYAEEIWSFGGAMPAILPETLSLLEQRGVDPRSSFVSYFNLHPRSLLRPMDFLEIKLLRISEWIETLARERGPSFDPVRAAAEKEVRLLMDAQTQYNGDPL